MRAVFALLVLVGALVGAAAGEDSLESEIETLHRKVSAVFEKASDFAKKGDTDSAEHELFGILDGDHSTAAALAVGDALYNTDRAQSYKLHKQAYEAEPHDRATILEWGMERHRAGEYAEAVPLYEEYLKLVPDDGRISALLADSLIRTGKLKEAVAAWDASHHPSQYTSIDFAIYEIYGELSPVARRGELLKQIRAGKLDLIEKLIDLDLDFNQDWWNSNVDKTALMFDLPFVQGLLKADQPRWESIECWVDVSKDETISAAAVQGRLKKAGLIVDGGALPVSSLVAARLIGIALDKKLSTPDDLLKRFEAELVERAKSKAGDVEALNILCNLTEDKQDRLGEFDRYGWERYGDFRFVGGTLAAMSIQGKLKEDSPELQKALQQFAENAIVNQFAIRATGPGKVSTSDLVRAIKAEFREPSIGVAIRDTYTLKSYFQLLKSKPQSNN